MKIYITDYEKLPSKFRNKFKRNFFNKEEREQTAKDN
jgi:hypothetical protein